MCDPAYSFKQQLSAWQRAHMTLSPDTLGEKSVASSHSHNSKLDRTTPRDKAVTKGVPPQAITAHTGGYREVSNPFQFLPDIVFAHRFQFARLSGLTDCTWHD
ncbi:hypothetical protein BaRGS_00035096 [Batillaria attramentaria]|uniref:Uncharacterized protein n=1 Tax=Batillaria attramentaria TaxID=370345 RepID=A0ABD0JG18_9CAEN